MADEEEVAARTAERSTRYPGVSLQAALKAAEVLYKAERQSPVTTATAVAKIGFKSLSGPARVMIGALRQYGLVENLSASAQIRLTRLAIELIHGSENQKAKALKAAALKPALFADLSKTHLHASEDNLKSYLIVNKHFIDTGARIAAKAFRETMSLAKIADSDYSSESSPRNGGDDDTEELSQPMMETPAPVSKPQPSSAAPLGSAIPPQSWVLSIPRGVTAELRISGRELRREDLERLKKQIDFLVESFEDSTD